MKDNLCLMYREYRIEPTIFNGYRTTIEKDGHTLYVVSEYYGHFGDNICRVWEKKDGDNEYLYECSGRINIRMLTEAIDWVLDTDIEEILDVQRR